MPQLNAASTDSHRFAESAAPSTPASGFAQVYVGTDKLPHLVNDAGSNIVIGRNLGAQSELTIATGAVTITGPVHSIDTESDAASDDLDTINGGVSGDLLLIRANNDARTVVVKNGTGNILTFDASDVSLDEDNKYITLYYDGTNWQQTGGGGAGTIGGATGGTDNAILRADGTGGSTLQNSGVTIDDSDNISGVASIVMDTSHTLIVSTLYNNKLRTQDGSSYDQIYRSSGGAKSSDTTIANTVTETSILSLYGNQNIPANMFTEAKTLKVVLMGYFSTTGTPTLQFRCKFGSTELITTGAVTMPSSVTDAGWKIEFLVACRTTGASGTVASSGEFTYNSGSVVNCVKTSTTTVDTTGSLTVNVTAQWGTADAANTVTAQVGYFDYIL